MAKILIIDDDPSFRKMIDFALTRSHHDVILASDGVIGLALFRAKQPDLVISDIVMPNKEGIETIRELRAMSAAIPIIAMSGGGSEQGTLYLDAAQHLGANSILSKPFRPSQLVELVDTLLAAARDG